MSTESIKAAFREPFAWHWTDATGCLFITGDERKPDIPADAKPLYAVAPSAISSLISSYEAMERRVEELEESLTPFASYRTADGLDGTDFLRIPDGHPVLFNMKSLGEFAAVDFTVTIGDFRRARSALTTTLEKVETPAHGTPAPEIHVEGEANG